MLSTSNYFLSVSVSLASDRIKSNESNCLDIILISLLDRWWKKKATKCLHVRCEESHLGERILPLGTDRQTDELVTLYES